MIMEMIPALIYVLTAIICSQTTAEVDNNKSYSVDVPRRETVFINNEAVVVDEAELKMIKDLSMKKGLYLNKGRSQQSRNPQVNSKIIPERKTWVNNFKKGHNKINRDSDVPPMPSAVKNTPQGMDVRTFRFVADPAKAHLVEDVSSAEVEKLKTLARNGTPEGRDPWRANVPPAQESATVKYEQTHRSFIEVLIGELKSLGSFLNKREIYGDITNVVYNWYLWIVDWFNGYKRELLR